MVLLVVLLVVLVTCCLLIVLCCWCSVLCCWCFVLCCLPWVAVVLVLWWCCCSVAGVLWVLLVLLGVLCFAAALFMGGLDGLGSATGVAVLVLVCGAGVVLAVSCVWRLGAVKKLGIWFCSCPVLVLVCAASSRGAAAVWYCGAVAVVLSCWGRGFGWERPARTCNVFAAACWGVPRLEFS